MTYLVKFLLLFGDICGVKVRAEFDERILTSALVLNESFHHFCYFLSFSKRLVVCFKNSLQPLTNMWSCEKEFSFFCLEVFSPVCVYMFPFYCIVFICAN